MKSLYSVPQECKDGTWGKGTQCLSFGKPSEPLQSRRKAVTVPSDLFRAGFPIQLSICDSAPDSSVHLKFLSMLRMLAMPSIFCKAHSGGNGKRSINP